MSHLNLESVLSQTYLCMPSQERSNFNMSYSDCSSFIFLCNNFNVDIHIDLTFYFKELEPIIINTKKSKKRTL